MSKVVPIDASVATLKQMFSHAPEDIEYYKIVKGFYLAYSPDEDNSGLYPPHHATHKFWIQEGLRKVKHSYKLLDVQDAEMIDFVDNLIKAFPGDVKDETWIEKVYEAYADTYSPKGIKSAAVKDLFNYYYTPQQHTAYLFIKQFDPQARPRFDLIPKPVTPIVIEDGVNGLVSITDRRRRRLLNELREDYAPEEIDEKIKIARSHLTWANKDSLLQKEITAYIKILQGVYDAG